MARLPVLISGSGLCGLLIARALLTHDIPFIIYEKDENVFKRAQGYRLRLSDEGLAAVKDILTIDDWEELQSCIVTTRGAGVQVVNASTAEMKDWIPEKPQEESKQMETSENLEGAVEPDENQDQEKASTVKEIHGASRTALRDGLMKKVKEKIQWNKEVISYTSSSEGVIAHFTDGSSSPLGSLLIAADGVRSRIARQVSADKLQLFNTHSVMIHGQTTAKAFQALGEGVFAVSDTSRPGDQKVWMVCNVRPGSKDDPQETLGWTLVCSPGLITPPENKLDAFGKIAADLSRDLTAKWNEKLRPIFENQNDGEAGFWKMTTSQPEGVPHWPNDARVTVAGDAVHSMTPAAGNGANTALQSANMLGSLLRENMGWFPDLTATYEERMRPMASKNVRESFESARIRFGIGALSIES